ncbi:MAG TPA: hypothetical protein VKZ18_17920 [Polyangia bacterium]|nr:hypothetical protein [Polyangia bacterium]
MKDAPHRSSLILLIMMSVGVALAAGCGSSSTDTGQNGTGGSASGGTSGATGGATGAGGTTGSGGATGTGGLEGTGGVAATGGTTGQGGATGTGGATGQGGSSGATGTGGKGTGGATSTGGTTGQGGSSGATGTGGVKGTGGSSATGGATGTGGTTGAGGVSGTGGTMTADKVFNPCRFHFGTIDTIATANPSMIPQLDFFTPGWMGQSDTFDMSSVCKEATGSGALANQVPVIVAYVAAFYVKRHNGLCDCNVTTCGTNNDLCHKGAADITAAMSSILAVYKSYAQGFASCYGTTRPIVFEMEPDFYQYTGSSESSPWTFAQAGQIMGQFVAAMKQYLPNAAFSMDISPWVGTNNNTGSDGSDNGKNWYSNFDLTQFTFINTSGGSTDAATAKIRSDAMTWAGVSQVTGKPILADTGYGVNGSSAGPDPAWDSPTNINARITDGVISISQYNPSSSWGSTISSDRSQLNTPKFCP